MRELANGVFQFTFGDPEKLTPVALRRTAADYGGLQKKERTSCPIREEDFQFMTGMAGCTVSLPMKSSEKIYGFGLQLKSFIQNGKKKIIRTNADPIADTGDSHAPIPFYVSSAGYGVLADTARYAEFYCGSSAPKNKKGVNRARLKSFTG